MSTINHVLSGNRAVIIILMLALLSLLVAACTPTVEVQREQFSAALDEAEAADIEISVPFERLNVSAMDAASTELITADIEFIGTMTFDVSGDNDRQVVIREDMRNLNYQGGEQLDWAVQLNPVVPMALNLDVASGSIDADLSDLLITELSLDVSSGEAVVSLPVMEEIIQASIDVSSGEVTVNIPEGAVFALDEVSLSSGTVTFNAENAIVTTDVDVSSGEVVFDLANDAPVRVMVDDVASGDVELPSDYVRISGDEDEQEGVWVSPSYEGAAEEERIELTVRISSGSVEVR